MPLVFPIRGVHAGSSAAYSNGYGDQHGVLGIYIFPYLPVKGTVRNSTFGAVSSGKGQAQRQ